MTYPNPFTYPAIFAWIFTVTGGLLTTFVDPSAMAMLLGCGIAAVMFTICYFICRV